MKICHITMYYHPVLGGQETYISNLNKVLEENGIKTFVLQPERLYPNKPENVFFTRYLPYSHYLRKLTSHWEWYVFSLSLFFYRKKLNGFDALICHYPFHFPFIKWHKRVVVVSHGVLWTNKVSERSIFDKLHFRFAKKVRQAKNVTVVANDTDFLRQIGLKAEVGKKYFEQIEKGFWFIPNCVDLKQFKRLTGIQKEKIILVPRNIRPDRGIDLAIRAFSMLPEKFADYKLFIAGNLSDVKYVEYCKSLVTDLRLNERVYFLGNTPWDKMIELYNKAAISVIPTIEKEGTSLSALESIASGTPVVSTFAGGLADLPTFHCKTDPEDLKNALVKVLEDTGKYADLQNADVVKTFNIENWGNAWVKALTS